MYVSSNWEEKDPKKLDTTYLANALAKCYREIKNSLNENDYKRYKNNIKVLTIELDRRLEKLELEKKGENKYE